MKSESCINVDALSERVRRKGGGTDNSRAAFGEINSRFHTFGREGNSREKETASMAEDDCVCIG